MPDLPDGAGDFGVAGLPDEPDCQVTEGYHDPRRGSRPNLRGILTVCNITDPVDLVLDPGSGRVSDQWATLLRANGRIDLPGWPRQGSWRWPCAPLADLNGQPPVTAPPALEAAPCVRKLAPPQNWPRTRGPVTRGLVRLIQCDGTGAAEAPGSRPARTHCGRACCASTDDPLTLEEWHKFFASAPQ